MDLDAVKALTNWLATMTEGVAGLVIAAAVIEAAVRTVGLLLRHRDPDASHEAKEEVRLRLGRWLALALEFELGADILRTAVTPTWSEIGQLAAVAAIRTALNFFLQPQDSPHFQTAPNISLKTCCAASIRANCSTRGCRRYSGMVGMSS
jgi:uncharacterized membrane protein